MHVTLNGQVTIPGGVCRSAIWNFSAPHKITARLALTGGRSAIAAFIASIARILRFAAAAPLPSPIANIDIGGDLYQTVIAGGRITAPSPHRATRGAQIATLEIHHPGYFEATTETALITNSAVHSGDILDAAYTPAGDQPAPIELHMTAASASPYGSGYIQHIVAAATCGYHAGQTIEKGALTAASGPTTVTGAQYRGGEAWLWTGIANAAEIPILFANISPNTNQHPHALLVSVHDYTGNIAIRPKLSTPDGNHQWTGEAVPITRNGILDLGTIPVAPWNQNGGIYGTVTIGLYAYGSGNLSVDYITVAPALGGYIHAHPTDHTLQSGLPTNNTLYIAPPYVNTSPNLGGGTTRTHYPIGTHPRVLPAYAQDGMMHLTVAFDNYIYGAHPDATLTISALYRPRYATL